MAVRDTYILSEWFVATEGLGPQFQQLLNRLPIGVAVLHPQGSLVGVNPAFANLLGMRGADRQRLQDALLHGEVALFESDELSASVFGEGLLEASGFPAPDSGSGASESAVPLKLRRHDGRIVELEVRFWFLPVPEGYMAVIFSEISALAETTDTASLSSQTSLIPLLDAHYDTLTYLPNRALLDDRINQALALANRNANMLAICHLDLDNFRNINETWGTALGDALLRDIGQRIKGSLRGSDTIARIGGDEFVLLLGEINSPRELEQTLARLIEALREPFQIADHRLMVTASLGVAIAPDEGCDPDPLLRHAGQAMYTAKQLGGNRYHLFDVAKDAEARKQRDIQSRIAQALERGEFRLYYQPKVNMRTGRVTSVEALIRWQHPEQGLLSPAAFLPQTEGHPSDIAIGEWVIAEALRQSCQWARAGLSMPISVNISAHHLQHPDFVPYLAETLEGMTALYPGMDPRLLELEILETAALGDVAYVSKVIDACLELGVSFSIDDFGTGYSSLTYLKRLQAGTLKIDQSFVRDMLDNQDDLAIVEGVIGLAAAFRRKVVAEGVESVPHGLMLMHLGCDLAQGYVIARPMPPGEIPGWMSDFLPHPAWSKSLSYPWRREDFPLLSADFDHHRWIEQVLQLLESTKADASSGSATLLDPATDRFGVWYQSRGLVKFGHMREFSVLGQLHEHVHRIAKRMIQFHLSGQSEMAQALIVPLRAASGDFLEALDEFRQEMGNLMEMPPTHWSQIRGS